MRYEKWCILVPLRFWAQAVGAAGTEVAVAGAVKEYERGDFEEALGAFAQLADNGNAKVQYYLGQMHANAEGTAANPDTAVTWHQESASAGHALAQTRLGELYRDGLLGVGRDASPAYSWFDIAAGSGSDRTSAAQARDAIAEELSTAELKRVRLLARHRARRTPPQHLAQNQLSSIRQPLRMSHEPLH